MSDEKHAKYVFKFECDQKWEDLLKTPDEKVRQCQRCDLNVHLAQNYDEFTAGAERGNCIYSPDIRTAGIPFVPNQDE